MNDLERADKLLRDIVRARRCLNLAESTITMGEGGDIDFQKMIELLREAKEVTGLLLSASKSGWEAQMSKADDWSILNG